jgi:hypothetical protein
MLGGDFIVGEVSGSTFTITDMFNHAKPYAKPKTDAV